LGVRDSEKVGRGRWSLPNVRFYNPVKVEGQLSPMNI